MFCGTGFVYLFHLSFICARIMKVCKLFLSLISWYLSKIGEWKWKTLLAINAKNWKVYINYLWDMLEIYIHTPINTNTQISRLFHFEKWTVRHVSRLCLSFFQKRIISRNLLLIPLMSGCLVVQAHNFFHAPWQMGGWGWATLSLSSLCIVNKNVCCEKEWGISPRPPDATCLLLSSISSDMIPIL